MIGVIKVQTPVYPRWRGEHARILHRRTRNTGLSPLARGTLCIHSMHIPENRFIPAGAGNTVSFAYNVGSRAVYPRWRGEHWIGGVSSHSSRGLSPLARGTLPYKERNEAKARFIPAGAGNTWHRSAVTSAAAVYPRWRGEHYISAVNDGGNGGLSPLARGTH